MTELSFWQRLQIAWASFRGVGGFDLPDLGRSSEENLTNSISGYLNRFSTISPIVNFEMLECLRNFWIFNPDFSQYVSNIQNLGNTGHQVVVDAASDAQAEAALKRINETAARIYKNGAGVDGLFNAYFAQIAWSGALSSEDVVDFKGKRIAQTVIVPVLQIRFKFDDELQEYVPYQRSMNYSKQNRLREFGLIRLHPATYRYFALQTIENSPYAKPPGSAAVDVITNSQKPILENIQYIAKKLGLMGLFSANVASPPKKPNETVEEHHKRSSVYLKAVAARIEQYVSKGLLVGFKDQTFEHTDISGGARGVYDLNRISEEQVMSGLAMQPAFFGRTDSTTETYADVVYNLLLAQVQNIQRLVKRRQEQTYRLDFRLGGIEVEGVSIKFNRTFSRNRIQEAQATETELRIAVTKAEKGIISADEAAQELGYESAHDPAILEENVSLAIALRNLRWADKKVQSFAFRFDKDSQKYKILPSQINIGGTDQTGAENFSETNIVPFDQKKKTALSAKA